MNKFMDCSRKYLQINCYLKNTFYPTWRSRKLQRLKHWNAISKFKNISRCLLAETQLFRDTCLIDIIVVMCNIHASFARTASRKWAKNFIFTSQKWIVFGLNHGEKLLSWKLHKTISYINYICYASTTFDTEIINKSFKNELFIYFIYFTFLLC